MSLANRRRRPAAELRHSPSLTSAHRAANLSIIAGREGSAESGGRSATMAETTRMTKDAAISVVPANEATWRVGIGAEQRYLRPRGRVEASPR